MSKIISEAEGRLPFGSFIVSNLGSEFMRYEGRGMTLEQAIEAETRILGSGYRDDVGIEQTGNQTGEAYVADSYDSVISVGRRVVAVLHLQANGRVIVTRIDQAPGEKEAEARLPFRSFKVCSLGVEFVQFEGHGMTLDRAIERESRALRDSYDEPDTSGEEYVRSVTDESIYEGNRLMAVLRLRTDGSVDVTRIDPEP